MKKFLMITITVCLLAGGVNAFAYGINSFTVYDAQDNIVHKITAKSEVNALYLLFQESLQIAADEALFTELPKDAQVLYRYVLSYNYGDDEQYFSFIVYKNYPLCRIPQLQEKEDIPKELTWKLFKYAYEIAGKPAEVKKQLSYSAKNSYIRIYDDKSSLLLFITGEKILDIFDTLFGKDIAEIEIEERNLKSLFTAESVHNGREVLVHYSFMDDDKIMKLYLYKDTKEMNITTDTGVLKVNLSEEAYRILSNPKSFQAENSAKTAGTGKAILGISPHEKEITVTAVTADDSPVQVEGCTVTELPSDEETILTATGTKVVLKGNITELDCSSNELTALDVRGLTALQTLYCDNNLLTSIDLHGLTALQELYCNDNEIASLDVRGLTALQALYCDNNRLTSLDVQGLTALQELDCSSNAIASIDVRGLTGLRMLYCENNRLTSLDVQGLTALQKLVCSDNQLTALNVQGLPALQALVFQHNRLEEDALIRILNSLPDRKTDEEAEAVFYTEEDSRNEGNYTDWKSSIGLQAAIKTARAKNWTLYKQVGGEDFEELEVTEESERGTGFGGAAVPIDKTYTVKGVSFTMKGITAVTDAVLGDNSMEDNQEHSVNLSAYYIGETEVTQERQV